MSTVESLPWAVIDERMESFGFAGAFRVKSDAEDFAKRLSADGNAIVVPTATGTPVQDRLRETVAFEDGRVVPV